MQGASRMTRDVPGIVRRTALAQGLIGQQWLTTLPATIADLEAQWHVTIGAAITGGSAAYVADATAADGQSLIVKVAVPSAEEGDTAFQRSVEALKLDAGRGCVRLLAYDSARSAMLLERLGRTLASFALPVERQLDIIASCLRRIWIPVPAATALMTGAAKARWLSDFIAAAWESHGRPCTRLAVDIARDFAAQRAAAFDRATAVLVHGDAHPWNTLDAGAGAFKLIDPEGLLSEPAHDLGIPIREYNHELLNGDAVALGRSWARRLGDATGVDPGAIWQWAFIERVSTGLYTLQLGHADALEFLRVADRWAAED